MAAGDLPLVVLLGEDCADEPPDRSPGSGRCPPRQFGLLATEPSDMAAALDIGATGRDARHQPLSRQSPRPFKNGCRGSLLLAYER